MSRRRYKKPLFQDKTQDPGKDLFAYLFLLIMVFSFMLLMTTDECRDAVSGQKSPERSNSSSGSSLASVAFEKIGRMVKKDGKLYLAFGKILYDPKKDVEKLENDGRITTIIDKDDVQRRLLYIEEDNDQKVFLTEYLDAFEYLSNQGIGVAFSERVK
jgi:hypothetical protein